MDDKKIDFIIDNLNSASIGLWVINDFPKRYRLCDNRKKVVLTIERHQIDTIMHYGPMGGQHYIKICGRKHDVLCEQLDKIERRIAAKKERDRKRAEKEQKRAKKKALDGVCLFLNRRDFCKKFGVL